MDHVYSIRKEAATSGGERVVISIYYGRDFTEERGQRRREESLDQSLPSVKTGG